MNTLFNKIAKVTNADILTDAWGDAAHLASSSSSKEIKAEFNRLFRNMAIRNLSLSIIELALLIVLYKYFGAAFFTSKIVAAIVAYAAVCAISIPVRRAHNKYTANQFKSFSNGIDATCIATE